jgi:hypothetical protein
MSSTDALDLLRRHDPALHLEPLSHSDRDLLRERIVARRPSSGSARRRPRRMLAVALALVCLAAVAAGAAWAAGTWSPVALFEHNLEADNGNPSDTLWQQKVLPNSTIKAATVDLPTVGVVSFWYADTAQKGWCGAIRLPDGAWLGRLDDPLDAGGTVPGCYPTREQVNGKDPVYVINGFDYNEEDVDARKRGGSYWRIRFGLVTAPGAVRVTDLASGRSTPVVHHDLFMLAIPDPNPDGRTPLHLVAFDAAGKVVADDH